MNATPLLVGLPRLRLAVIALASLLLAGTLGVSMPGCTLSQPEPLRVGINPWPGYEFIYLAQQQGFFAARGVEVRLVEFTSLSDTRRAFERGQIDVMGTTVVEVLQAAQHSTRRPQIVRVVDYSSGADVILAKPGIDGVRDLAGKRVGVELGSVAVYVLARALASAGLALKDVTLLPMDSFTMEDRFRQHDVQAIVTYPPSSVALLRDHIGHVVFTTAGMPGDVLDVLSVDAAVLDTRAADIGRLLGGYDDAVAFAAAAPAEADRLMGAREGLAAAEFRAVLERGITLVGTAAQPSYFAPGGKLAAVIADTARVLREAGHLRGPDRGTVSDARFGGRTEAP